MIGRRPNLNERRVTFAPFHRLDELVRENAEDQRTDHVAEEENRLNETFQRDAITNHRPL